MKKVSPWQINTIGRLFFFFLILLSLIWAVISYKAFGDIYVHRDILITNLVLSGISACLLYKYRYHITFSYDDARFELAKGKYKISEKWKDFSLVSLVHLGYGRFSVRLYKRSDQNPESTKQETEFIDIPATDLKLDPFEFRFKVMALVSRDTPSLI